MNVDETNAGAVNSPAGPERSTPAVPSPAPAAAVPAAPPITLEAFPEYIIGFPLVVALTIQNNTPNSTFYHLPAADLFTAPGPCEFILTPANGEKITLPAASPGKRETPGGFTLRPGEARRMLYDISGQEPPLVPGTYRLEAIYRLRVGSSTSPPVQIRLVEPTRADSAAAARLRQENDLGEPRWSNFLEGNWRTVDASKLSAKGRDALALHLFLHRAIYGPEAVAELSPAETQSFARGPLEGEAALLRFEIFTARKSPAAAMEEAFILKKWPGLQWRVEEVKRGEGMVTLLRQSVGAEQQFETPPPRYPYKTK